MNAFSEGWGLYFETLRKEMGLYEDANAYAGHLFLDMMRAARLVVGYTFSLPSSSSHGFNPGRLGNALRDLRWAVVRMMFIARKLSLCHLPSDARLRFILP